MRWFIVKTLNSNVFLYIYSLLVYIYYMIIDVLYSLCLYSELG